MPILRRLGAYNRFQEAHGQASFDIAVSTCVLDDLLWMAAALEMRREVVSVACDFADRVKQPHWDENHPAVLAGMTARAWTREEVDHEACLPRLAAIKWYYEKELDNRGCSMEALRAELAFRFALEAAYYSKFAAAGRACAAARNAYAHARYKDGSTAEIEERAWQIAHARSVFTPDLLWSATVKLLA